MNPLTELLMIDEHDLSAAPDQIYLQVFCEKIIRCPTKTAKSRVCRG